MEESTFKEVEGPSEAAPRVSDPMSTDSMVTIRLSNSPITPTADSTIDVSLVDPSLQGNNDQAADQKSINTSEGQVAPEAPGQNNDDSDTLVADEVKLFQRSHRMSTVSLPSIKEEEKEEEGSNQDSKSLRSRSDSSSTRSSAVSAFVDWEELDKTEESVPRDEGSDESIAFLLARLEQENDALATDPKAAMSRSTRGRTKSRPPSIQQLKKLVNEPTKPSLRYSALPEPPPMTELEFWAALVTNYSQTAQRLPTLTSSKIRNGVPPPLRGVVWISITGARDQLLEEKYEKLCTETSPYENLIGKDIGRSFPSVEMFKDPSGE
ncbi:MAG: hypothetical protein Q9214_005638, partial [Letrouitia sp. 1 TL-2023]